MTICHLDQSKIRPEHRERVAYVYVRQSSPRQVREHQESRRRQYAFAEQARAPTSPRRAARRRSQPNTVRRKTRKTARVSGASNAS